MPNPVQRLEKECGATLVEFALALMMFLTILLGICGFGHALYAYHFVSHAAKSATRWAAVNGATCGPAGDNSCNGTDDMSNGPADAAAVLNYVQKMAPLGIDPSKITTPVVCGVQGGANCAASIPAICATTPNAPGCTVEVQVSYNFSFIFPLIRTSPLTLQSTSQMVIAH